MNIKYVNIAVDLAKKSYSLDEVPVGAVVVMNNEIIGMGYNDREKTHLVTGHAEIMAINEACEFLNDWRLDKCDLYVTLKPCMMCAGAIFDSRIRNVFYLCNRTNVCFNYDDNNYILVDDEENRQKYVDLLKLFFENKRN